MNYSVNDAEQALQKIKAQRPVHFIGHGFVNCPVYNRAALSAGERILGPAIIEQMDSTSVIFPGSAGRVRHIREHDCQLPLNPKRDVPWT